ncbi:MAG: phosphate/phosphite/phosphonate ABC transporter substrate-binding protein [Deltaproteobacteria bacterium]|nr:phosphate/phosphite/phosphonate ABC transporter substrate-binding protein [Deltaproteobacteria bacterium]
MDSITEIKRVNVHWLFTLLIGFLLSLWGCFGDPEGVVVDFNKTKPVERPREMSVDTKRIRVAVGAMISPKETFAYYQSLLDYIGGKLDAEVELIQRKTYEEINELFGKGQIDLAFICSGPYATGKDIYGFEILATPQVRGSPFYQSYLIVNKASPFHTFEDLKGKVFAFTDPNSNTGWLVPVYWLAQMGERPETFFDRTIYTYSHDNSILAVGRGLVDGAAIDGLIWEYYHKRRPSLTEQARIIKKSETYGIPPLVVSRHLNQQLKDQIRDVVFQMHLEPEGKEILEELLIDRFIVPEQNWYSGIVEMAQRVSRDEK